eukprot:GDKJ01017046.1.p1 GENE.GDKJ01017046.1~~GDKJ01017046.1.p1  ORF type:complete len:882 (-),score=156.48 GDKJ01017046.1:3278-5548(-)
MKPLFMEYISSILNIENASNFRRFLTSINPNDIANLLKVVEDIFCDCQESEKQLLKDFLTHLEVELSWKLPIASSIDVASSFSSLANIGRLQNSFDILSVYCSLFSFDFERFSTKTEKKPPQQVDSTEIQCEFLLKSNLNNMESRQLASVCLALSKVLSSPGPEISSALYASVKDTNQKMISLFDDKSQKKSAGESQSKTDHRQEVGMEKFDVENLSWEGVNQILMSARVTGDLSCLSCLFQHAFHLLEQQGSLRRNQNFSSLSNFMLSYGAALSSSSTGILSDGVQSHSHSRLLDLKPLICSFFLQRQGEREESLLAAILETCSANSCHQFLMGIQWIGLLENENFIFAGEAVAAISTNIAKKKHKQSKVKEDVLMLCSLVNCLSSSLFSSKPPLLYHDATFDILKTLFSLIHCNLYPSVPNIITGNSLVSLCEATFKMTSVLDSIYSTELSDQDDSPNAFKLRRDMAKMSRLLTSHLKTRSELNQWKHTYENELKEVGDLLRRKGLQLPDQFADSRERQLSHFELEEEKLEEQTHSEIQGNGFHEIEDDESSSNSVSESLKKARERFAISRSNGVKQEHSNRFLTSKFDKNDPLRSNLDTFAPLHPKLWLPPKLPSRRESVSSRIKDSEHPDFERARKMEEFERRDRSRLNSSEKNIVKEERFIKQKTAQSHVSDLRKAVFETGAQARDAQKKQIENRKTVLQHAASMDEDLLSEDVRDAVVSPFDVQKFEERFNKALDFNSHENEKKSTTRRF